MTPNSETELAEAITAAQGPLHVQGGGTRDIGAPVAGQVLSTAGLSGVTLYEPGALTLVAKAGTPLTEIEALLAAEGQRLPFEPMDHRPLLGTTGTPTIGGVVAANVSGPRRIQVGAARDFALGVRFVDGTGQVLKNGGRVMKNVTGYDLVKLMAGSWGTLGVLSEVSLKVGAIPETEATLVARGLEDDAAVAALSAALGSPFDVSGAAHLDAGANGGQSETRVRIEGLAGSVAYRAARLGEGVCKGWELVEAATSAALWLEVRDVGSLQTKPGNIWRFSLKPSDAPGMAEAIRRAHPEAACVFDWGGGLLWVSGPEGADLRPKGLKGHATLVRAARETRERLAVFQPESTPIAAITAGLRHKFDPRGILNPGLMGG
ncbi:FAD-binding protein [Aliiroseovarius subalbicans]|uniref:FAD-binding protein n=1 Tax=Aliiroseovarius subalbicans TaxID=2925840 RepID=UPI001F56BA1E|nr:FAD-binding protein [Aliiroseovarius subalbicans]MCI2400731.1 FAD-binding protein [Aliiroseovarius subalbicans]